eukprot:5199440-Pleurochrysis_carterae.AAC.1
MHASALESSCDEIGTKSLAKASGALVRALSGAWPFSHFGCAAQAHLCRNLRMQTRLYVPHILRPTMLQRAKNGGDS